MMWDQKYSVDECIYGTQANQFLSDNVDRLKVGRVLCLAEGEGRNAVFLVRRGFQVTAVDSSRVGLGISHGIEQVRPVVEGSCHSGNGAVVWIIAAKKTVPGER